MESGIEESQVNLVLAQAAQVGASKKPPGVGEVLVVVLLDKIGTVGGVSNVTVRGVPEDVFAFRSSAKIIEGRAAKPGTDEVVVGAGIRGRFKGLELGQSFEIKKNRPVKVVGVFSDDGSSFESEVWADVHTARTAFGREGYVSSIRVRLDCREQVRRVQGARRAGPPARSQRAARGRLLREAVRDDRRFPHHHGDHDRRALLDRRDDRRDDHDERAGREPAARDRHAARARLLAHAAS